MCDIGIQWGVFNPCATDCHDCSGGAHEHWTISQQRDCIVLYNWCCIFVPYATRASPVSFLLCYPLLIMKLHLWFIEVIHLPAKTLKGQDIVTLAVRASLVSHLNALTATLIYVRTVPRYSILYFTLLRKVMKEKKEKNLISVSER